MGRVLVVMAFVASVGSLVTLSANASQSGPQRPEYCAYGNQGCEPEPVRRTPNGPVPRTSDGKPDMTGFWEAPRPLFSSKVIEEHSGGFGMTPGRTLITDPADGIIPYQPWALEERNRRRRSENAYEDPEGNCMLSGVPRIFLFHFWLYQRPDSVLVLSVYNTISRVIPLDGSPHVSDKIRLGMGDPRGRWDGDVLVVNTTNFNDQVWFALFGDFYSEHATLVERFALQDADTLAYEATVTDPTVFTRPWTLRYGPFRRVQGPGEEHEEDSCHEGNVDLEHIKALYDAARQER